MMTDRELLEKAAEAEGRSLGDWWPARGLPLMPHKEGYGCPEGTWNPLTDDGDALRLAVKLGIEIHPTLRGAVACYFPKDIRAHEFGDESYAATRRAIVRAAASMVGERWKR